MRAAIVRVVVGVLLLGAGCHREPAIVVRFDAVDQGGQAQAVKADASMLSPHDAAGPAGDASSAVAKERAAGDAEAKSPPKSPTGPAVPAKVAQCAAEADCVLIPDGCCSCANGGKQRAVPHRDEAKLRAAQQASCKDVMCTMMVSTDPTCGKRAACVEGACAMRDARPEEIRQLGPKAPAKK